jgi:DNA-binding CsgD family transcriptional regulator
VARELFDPVLRPAQAADRERLLDGADGALAALRGAPAAGSETPGSEFTTLHGLYRLPANLTDQGPVLVVLDDAQWADLASLRWLAFLIPRLAELPVLLLVCTREGPSDVIWARRALTLAACLAALGEQPERAQALMARELEHARRWGAPDALGAALRAQARMAGDDAGEALLPLTERAEEELRASGLSPRTVIEAGVRTLTASEQRVARLAADGLTNKQIALELFVTVKTVETHLSRSFQKLAVSSRAQLAAALAPAP